MSATILPHYQRTPLVAHQLRSGMLIEHTYAWGWNRTYTDLLFITSDPLVSPNSDMVLFEHRIVQSNNPQHPMLGRKVTTCTAGDNPNFVVLEAPEGVHDCNGADPCHCGV